MGVKDYRFTQLVIGSEEDINNYYDNIEDNLIFNDEDYVFNDYYLFNHKPYREVKKYKNYLLIEYHILEGGMISMGGTPIDNMDDRLQRIADKYPEMYFVLELDYERGDDIACFVFNNKIDFWVEETRIDQEVLNKTNIYIGKSERDFYYIQQILLEDYQDTQYGKYF